MDIFKTSSALIPNFSWSIIIHYVVTLLPAKIDPVPVASSLLYHVQYPTDSAASKIKFPHLFSCNITVEQVRITINLSFIIVVLPLVDNGTGRVSGISSNNTSVAFRDNFPISVTWPNSVRLGLLTRQTMGLPEVVVYP